LVEVFQYFFILSLLIFCDLYSYAMENMWIQAFWYSITPIFPIRWAQNYVRICVNLSSPMHALTGCNSNFNHLSTKSRQTTKATRVSGRG